MNTLSRFIDGSFSTRLTVALLHFLWQGCAGGMLAIVGGWLLRTATARFRYSLNVALLLMMAVCLPVTFCLVALPNATVDQAASLQQFGASQNSNSASLDTQTSSTWHVDSSMPQRADSMESVAESNDNTSEVRATPAVTHDSSVLPQRFLPSFSTTLTADTFQSLTRWVTALYLSGVVLILGRLLRGVWGGRRLRKMAHGINDAELLTIVSELAHRLGLKVAPTIAWCEQISIPVVVGIVKPMILLPLAIVSGLTPHQLQALLLHEMAHIHRFDPIVNLCQRMIEAVLFFHPVVWFVSRRVSTERELAADDIVLAAGWERPLYADALVRVAELASAITSSSAARRATVLGASGSSPTEFKVRVLRLLGESHPPKLEFTRVGILVTILFVATGGIFAWSQPKKSEPQSDHNNPVAAQEDVAKELDPHQSPIPQTPTDPKSNPSAEPDPTPSQKPEEQEPIPNVAVPGERTGAAHRPLVLVGHTDFVTCVAFSPDGQRVASSSRDSTIKVWDAVTGRESLTLKESATKLSDGHVGSVQSVAFSPDGRYLVSGGADKMGRVWNAVTGRADCGLFTNGAVLSVAYNSGGTRIATASADNTVRVWDANPEMHEGVHILSMAAQDPLSVAFSPDGKRLAAAGRDMKVRVWDAVTSEELLTVKQSGQALCLKFSPDGKRIAIAVGNGVYVCDSTDGKTLLHFRGHTQPVVSVAFSPDGARLASAGWDQVVKLWNSNTGEELLKLNGHGNRVSSVAFSPDGKRLVTGSADRTVRVWDLRAVVALADPKPPVPPEQRDEKTVAPEETPSAANNGVQAIPSAEPVPANSQKPIPKELEPFQGIWTMVGCDSETRILYAPQEVVRHWRWIVKGDEILWQRERQEWKLSLKVNPTKTPKEIDLTYLSGPFKGETCQGMYQWGTAGGKSLQISIQDPGAKVARPTRFSMRSGGQTSLMVLNGIDNDYAVKQFQGTWSFEAESDAWPQPAGKKTEQRWVVKANEISWTNTDGKLIKASFTLDSGFSPKHFDLTFLNGPHAGKKCLGLYDEVAVGKKSFWLCLMEPDSKEIRPTDFTYVANAGRARILLEPVAPPVQQSSTNTNLPPGNVPGPAANKKPMDRDSIQGNWVVDALDSESATLKISYPLHRWRWTIKADEVVWGRTNQQWKLAVKLDPSTTPKQIDLTFLDGPHSGETCLGIYERSGDEGRNLRIRMQDPGAKIGRPTSFEMKKGSQTSLIALRSIPPIDPVKELASFQGTWSWDYSQPWTWPQPIGVGVDGDGRQSEKRWVIEGNRITWVGRDGQRVYVSFTLDPFKAPKQIEFTFLNGPHGGQKSIGIYESRGDDDYRELCMTDPGTDAPRPTDYEAGDFLKQSILVIHRVAPPAKPSVANELKRLQGVWKMTLCDSTLRTFGATQKEIENWQWTIKGDEILWRRQGGVWKLKLNVDPPKSPRVMDLTYLAAPFEMDLTFLSGPFKGAKCGGILGWGGVDGQCLMIAVQEPGSDLPRPTKFHMTSAEKTGLMILRPSNPSDAEREIGALQGSWTLRNFDTGNFEKNKDPSSWPLPAGKGPDKAGAGSELRWTITGNEISWTSRAGEEIKASYTIDSRQHPKQIDLTFLSGPDKGQTCPGIYQRGDLDENILWICIADPSSKKVRPKEFSYGWGEGRSLLSLYPFDPSTAAPIDASLKP